MDVFDLSARLSLDDKDFTSGLSKAKSLIGGGLANAGKMGAAAIGVAATAVGALAAKSVEGYADYEQMVGGVKKLYGNMGMSLDDYAKSVGKSTTQVKGEWNNLEKAQDIVLKNAKNAYKTAGVDMNAYMDTATSFSASLINSLGGNTVKAAKQTDVAMRAISDNFNTFGGDIGMIKGAFQGFAKQNYTMLDNLKLGYGGTKEEMQRLIQDANTYAKSIGKASDLSIDSFSDVVTAIELVQKKQGIAGTTAREAATTISGSFEKLKGAWQNLVTGFANPDADIGELVSNVMGAIAGETDAAGEHVNGFLDNVVPAISEAIEGIGEGVSKGLPQIVKLLGDTLSTLLPGLLSSAVKMIGSVVSTLPEAIGSVAEALPKAFSSVAKVLPEQLSSMASSVSSSFQKIGETISKFDFAAAGKNIGTSFRNMFGKIDFSAISKTLHDGIQKAIGSIGTLASDGTKLISGLLKGMKVKPGDILDVVTGIVTGIVDGITSALPGVVEAGTTLINGVASGIATGLPNLLESGLQSILKFSETLKSSASSIIDAGLNLIVSLSKGIADGLPSIISTVPQIVSNIASIISENAPKILVAGGKIILNLAKGLIQAIPTLVTSIPKIIEAIANVFFAFDWISVSKNVFTMLKNGFEAAKPAVIDTVEKIGKKAAKLFKEVDWDAVGKAAIKFIKNAVSNAGSTVWNALKTIGSKAAKLFKEIDWENVGKTAIKLIKNAISTAGNLVWKGLKVVGKTAAKAFKEVDWAAVGKAAIKFIKKAISTAGSLVWNGLKTVGETAAKKFKEVDWVSLGSNVLDGIVSGVRSGASRVANAIRDLASNAVKAAKKALDIHSPSRVFREEVGRQIAAGIALGITDNTEEVENALDKIANLTLQAAQKRLDNWKVYNTWSLEAEAGYWDEVRRQIGEGTQARIDADQKYFDADEKWTEARRSSFENARELTKKFALDYREVELSIMVNLDKMDRELKENIEKVNKKLAEDINEVDSELTRKIEERNSKLREDIRNVTETYQKSVESRTSSIMGMTNLFARVSYDRTYSKEYLLDTLKEQVGSLEDWDAQLDALQNRIGRDNPLFQSLQEMGVSSLYTLKEINGMSDEELQEYSSLYDKKSKVANARAVQENQKLLEDTNAQIELYRQQAEADIQLYRYQAEQNRLTLIQTAEKERETLREEAEKNKNEMLSEASEQMEELTKEYRKDLTELANTVKNDGETVGNMLCFGVQAGIEEKAGIMAEAATQAVMSAFQAAKSALEISSPSKKFAWIGKMVTEGFVRGISNGAKAIDSEMRQVFGFDQEQFSGRSYTTMATQTQGAGIGSFVQNLTVNAPQALMPSEIARQTRLANQQMVLALRGV